MFQLAYIFAAVASSECSPGDLVRATGRTVSDITGGTYAHCLEIKTIAHRPPPVPVDATSAYATHVPSTATSR